MSLIHLEDSSETYDSKLPRLVRQNINFNQLVSRKCCGIVDVVSIPVVQRGLVAFDLLNKQEDFKIGL